MEYRRKIHIGWYILSDYIAAVCTLLAYFAVRRLLLNDPILVNGEIVLTPSMLTELAILPLGWIMFYFLTGSYNSLYKKSRLNELMLTFLFSLFGCFLFSFFLLFNEVGKPANYYYQAFIWFVIIQFSITFMGRLILLNITKKTTERRKGDLQQPACGRLP